MTLVYWDLWTMYKRMSNVYYVVEYTPSKFGLTVSPSQKRTFQGIHLSDLTDLDECTYIVRYHPVSFVSYKVKMCTGQRIFSFPSFSSFYVVLINRFLHYKTQCTRDFPVVSECLEESLYLWSSVCYFAYEGLRRTHTSLQVPNRWFCRQDVSRS